MDYFILRDGLQYGPYSRSELQVYLRTGEVFPGDLGRSEQMNQWLPVLRLLGTAAPPQPSSVDSTSGGAENQREVSALSS